VADSARRLRGWVKYRKWTGEGLAHKLMPMLRPLRGSQAVDVIKAVRGQKTSWGPFASKKKKDNPELGDYRKLI